MGIRELFYIVGLCLSLFGKGGVADWSLCKIVRS
jgi:hypothetical protein